MSLLSSWIPLLSSVGVETYLLSSSLRIGIKKALLFTLLTYGLSTIGQISLSDAAVSTAQQKNISLFLPNIWNIEEWLCSFDATTESVLPILLFVALWLLLPSSIGKLLISYLFFGHSYCWLHVRRSILIANFFSVLTLFGLGVLLYWYFYSSPLWLQDLIDTGKNLWLQLT